MNSSIKDFFSKCNEIRSLLRIWSRLLKKSLMEEFIYCAVIGLYFLKFLFSDFKTQIIVCLDGKKPWLTETAWAVL